MLSSLLEASAHMSSPVVAKSPMGLGLNGEGAAAKPGLTIHASKKEKFEMCATLTKLLINITDNQDRGLLADDG